MYCMPEQGETTDLLKKNFMKGRKLWVEKKESKYSMHYCL